MKKILLVICLLLCTGCSDYVEINDLVIIPGMIIDYNEEYYTTQLKESMSTIDSLESKIKIQESIVDSFLNLRKEVRVEYIIKREEIKNLPIDSSVIILRNFIEEYEKDPGIFISNSPGKY